MTEGSETPLLELIGISKSFGGVQALRDVDFSLLARRDPRSRRRERRRQVDDDEDHRRRASRLSRARCASTASEVHFRSARDALDAGVGMVHQELSIVPDLTVAENVFLGSQPVTALGTVDWERMVRESREHLAGLGIDVDPTTRHRRVCRSACSSSSSSRGSCSPAPASSFSTSRPRRCRRRRSSSSSRTLRKLKRESGRSIVFISHFLDDILTHLRHGHDLPQRHEGAHRAGRGDRQAPGHRAA